MRRAVWSVLSVAAWVLLAACGATAGPERGVTISDVWDRAEALDGRTVTVSADVEPDLYDTFGADPYLVASTVEPLPPS